MHDFGNTFNHDDNVVISGLYIENQSLLFIHDSCQRHRLELDDLGVDTHSFKGFYLVIHDVSGYTSDEYLPLSLAGTDRLPEKVEVVCGNGHYRRSNVIYRFIER
ncbi:hypothetical protein ES703_69615 [subsurface metagenome]